MAKSKEANKSTGTLRSNEQAQIMLAEQVQGEGSYAEVRQKTPQHLTEEIVCEVACMSEGTQGKIRGVAASALWLFLRSRILFTSDRKD